MVRKLQHSVGRWLHAKHPDVYEEVQRLTRTRQVILLDYRVKPQARYTAPAHPHPELHDIIQAGVPRYAAFLERLVELTDKLARIPVDRPSDPRKPFWVNGWQPGLDCASLYGLTALERPTRYVEIGSGISTTFVACAVADHALSTQLVSIDPHPRAEIDELCDSVIREPLEALEPAVFDTLAAGDMLFFDGSHRCFTNSDVAVFFLEVLPRLPAGVLVGIHDIYLPYDYPTEVARRFYSEQYLLAVRLLSRSAPEDIVLPATFVSNDASLRSILEPLWEALPPGDLERHGGSFWFRT